MRRPLVSILVPVYNREGFLPACLQSAVNQTVRDVEVVVVDNASSDGTWGICRQFAESDSRVRIFRNADNIGPVRNWQRCFGEARGRYGKLLFSDDVMAPDFLEKTLPYLEVPEVAFVFTVAEIGTEVGQGELAYRWARHSGVRSSRAFILDAIGGRNLPVSPGAALFRMKDLRANLRLELPSSRIHNFSEHGAGVDLLVYLLTASSYPNVAYVSEPLVFFRSHSGSITLSTRHGLSADYYNEALVWFALQQKDSSLLERSLARAWLSAVKNQRRWLDPKTVLQNLVAGRAHVSFLSLLRGCLRYAVVRIISQGWGRLPGVGRPRRVNSRFTGPPPVS